MKKQLKTIKILFVAGTRPNFMKVAPLLRECKKYSTIKTILVHTGQHYDNNMSDVFFAELGIKPPDLLLNAGEYNDPNVQKEYIQNEIVTNYYEEGISLVVVVGDVNSTVGGALAGKKLGVLVAHIEAGLRSYDERMPEEHNRIAVDKIASLFFVTEASGMKNLKQKQFRLKERRAFWVGNTMIDTLLCTMPKILQTNAAKRFHLEKKRFVVLTLHRKENLENKDILENFLNMIDSISSKEKIIWPMHPRAEKELKIKGLFQRVKENTNILLTEPLGYLELLSLVGDSLCVITDSGGIQDETTVLGIPCLTIRRTTERPITTTVGSSTIVGESGEKLLRQFDRIQKGTYKKSKIPYRWDGKTSVRIVKKILELFRVSSK